jgi:transposase-like protein
MATHKVSTTTLEKVSPTRCDFSPIQELILSSYLCGNSIGQISNKLEMNFRAKIDSTVIYNTIDTFINSTLKWQSPDISSEYIIVFINPIFEQQVLKKRIGYLLVGITEHGKRHILGYCPLNTPKSYWVKVFEKLKKHGLRKINIICGPKNIHPSKEVVRLFPGIRVVESKALKKWYPESLSPTQNVHELISEINFINELLADKASYSLAKTI